MAERNGKRRGRKCRKNGAIDAFAIPAVAQRRAPQSPADARRLSRTVREWCVDLILTACRPAYPLRATIACAALLGAGLLALISGVVPALGAPQVSFDLPFAVSRYALAYTNNFAAPPSYAGNHSGCCTFAPTGTLLVIINRPQPPLSDCAIEEYAADGAFRRSIPLTGFDDTEGICEVDPASNLYAVLEERLNDITIVTITTNTTTIAKSSGRTLHMGLGDLANVGTEGVTFDPGSNVFYVVKEMEPMAVYRVQDLGTNAVTQPLFDAQARFSGVVTDLSDLWYDRDSGHLLILSDEGHRVLECDLEGNILSSLPVGMGQPEGLLLAADRSSLTVVGEPMQLSRFDYGPWSGSGPEGEPVSFLLRLSEAPTNAVTAGFTVMSETATAGIDYSPSTGLVTFALGEMTSSISLLCPPDLDLEGTETLQVALTNAVGADLDGTPWLTYSVVDTGRLRWQFSAGTQDAGTPFAVAIVAEDTNGVALTSFSNTVALSAYGSGGALAVSPTQSLAFAGGSWAGNITVFEEDPAVRLVASDGRGHIGTTASFVVQPPPLLALSTPAQVDETAGWLHDAGQVDIAESRVSNVVVTLTSSSVGRLAVSNLVTIDAGATSARFDLAVANDALLEGPQSVLITASASGFSAASNVVMVIDDETAHLVLDLPASVAEGAGTLTSAATVRIERAPAIPITVALSSDSPADATPPASVVIEAGQTQAVFSVTVPDNAALDGDRVVTITAHVDGWTDGSNSVTVLDNETASLALTLPAVVQEGGGRLAAAGWVALGGTVTHAVVVDLVSDRTAELSLTNRVVIPAGQPGAAFDLVVVDDVLKDGAQTVTVHAWASGFGDATGVVSVVDDDPDHLNWAAISGPRTSSIPFRVSVTAHTVDGLTATAYGGIALLSASGSNGVVSVSPSSSGAFSAGTWSGMITIGQADRDVRVTADDGWGMQGISTAFDVVARRVLYVATNGLNQTPFTNWLMAARTIQAAVNVSVPGDLILVTNGIYASGVAITPGGGANNRVVATNAILIASVNGPEVTVIAGQGPLGNAGARCAYLSGGAELQGFTLTNGFTRSGSAGLNTRGGGAYAVGGTLRDCIVAGNSAVAGGGVYGGTVIGSWIRDNSATSRGGGVDTAVVHGSLLAGNAAPNGGCARSGMLVNSTVVSNRAGTSGGGAYGTTLTNCIVAWNSAANGADVYTCNGGYSISIPALAGPGNLAAVPDFVNPSAGDYRLAPGSPGVDAGNNASASTETDLGGLPRVAFGTVDMGCYEYVVSTNDFDGDGVPNVDEEVAGTSATDPGSLFAVAEVGRTGSGGLLGWDGIAGRRYTVQMSTNLLDPSGWSDVLTAVFTNSCTFAIPPAESNGAVVRVFYRLRVERP